MANEKKELKIRFPEELQAGTYANNCIVSHTKEEFLLDFIMAAPPGGTLVSRVLVSPGHAKRFAAALQENIRKYEQNFGTVAAATPPVNFGESG